MKTIKINLITVLLLIAVTVLTILLIRKNRDTNKEIKKLRTENVELTARITADNIVLKLKNDTIEHYKSLVQSSKETITEQRKVISRKISEINSLKDKVKDIPPSKSYEFLQSNLPVRTDELKYDFSGNQVNKLHEEKLELLDSRELILAYQENEGEYDYVFMVMDSILVQYQESLQISNAQLKNCQSINSNKDKEIKKLTSQKRQRNYWIGATALAVLVAVLK